ncbi:MAG TPA: hypothetical protein VL284_02430 [Thermoanaerobaculia bacterium]|nr:hypothetical protein [Thermoanaerobaculia bacterium]
MKRIVAASSLLLVFATCEPVIRRVVTLTFNEPADLVTISASTALGNAKPGTPDAGRIADEREALLSGNDEWSVRFGNANPESDRIVMERRHGELQSLEHIASIAPDDLQKFFFDTHLTITFQRGEHSAELAIYPGTSDRATRQQREKVERALKTYSERAAHYFETIRGLYAYLDQKPGRAEDMFTAVFRDENDPPARVSDDEQKIVNGVRDAIDAVLANDDDTADLDRDFDVVFNPFPAEMRISVAGAILSSEGFTRTPDGLLVVKTPTALEAVTMLQGRWITPDPLAVAFSAPDNEPSQQIALALAAMPRRAEPVVSATDVAAALMEQMRPAPRYRVRWIVHNRKD